MNWIRNTIAGCAMGVAVACAAGVPMPAATPEEIIALAHRTYDYVAKSVPAKELAALKEELAIDEKWYTDAKKANDAREMRNAVRELKSVRRRILFRHPDLQFKRLLAVQRGLPFSQESGTTDQYAGRWSRPGPGLVAIDNWQEAPRTGLVLGRLTDCVVMGNTAHRAYIEKFIDDRGGHVNSVVRDNVGSSMGEPIVLDVGVDE